MDKNDISLEFDHCDISIIDIYGGTENKNCGIAPCLLSKLENNGNSTIIIMASNNNIYQTLKPLSDSIGMFLETKFKMMTNFDLSIMALIENKDKREINNDSNFKLNPLWFVVGILALMVCIIFCALLWFIRRLSKVKRTFNIRLEAALADIQMKNKMTPSDTVTITKPSMIKKYSKKKIPSFTDNDNETVRSFGTFTDNDSNHYHNKKISDHSNKYKPKHIKTEISEIESKHIEMAKNENVSISKMSSDEDEDDQKIIYLSQPAPNSEPESLAIPISPFSPNSNIILKRKSSNHSNHSNTNHSNIWNEEEKESEITKKNNDDILGDIFDIDKNLILDNYEDSEIYEVTEKDEVAQRRVTTLDFHQQLTEDVDDANVLLDDVVKEIEANSPR